MRCSFGKEPHRLVLCQTLPNRCQILRALLAGEKLVRPCIMRLCIGQIANDQINGCLIRTCPRSCPSVCRVARGFGRYGCRRPTWRNELCHICVCQRAFGIASIRLRTGPTRSTSIPRTGSPGSSLFSVDRPLGKSSVRSAMSIATWPETNAQAP
jgi:hypothetical protein